MTNYELAFDEDGEPFSVPPQVAGWRVRRAADGRGRPALIHGRGSEKGKPLIVRVNATHAELLAAAGPGKYRLEAVDEHWHKLEGVPVACTGPLSPDEDDTSEDDASTETRGGSAVRQIATSYEDVLCTVVTANTRMVEKALGQMGSVMAGVAELLNAAHNAGITSRVPPPLPPPAPPPPPVEIREDEEDEEEDEAEEAPTSGIPEFVRLLTNGSKAFVMPDAWMAVAASDGVLWSAGRTPRGFAVVVDHGNVATFYQHLETLLVPEAKPPAKGTPRDQLIQIKAGQPLGVIGADPLDPSHLKHLHFELWLGGPANAIDPQPLMKTWQVFTPNDIAPLLSPLTRNAARKPLEKRHGLVPVRAHQRRWPGGALSR